MSIDLKSARNWRKGPTGGQSLIAGARPLGQSPESGESHYGNTDELSRGEKNANAQIWLVNETRECAETPQGSNFRISCGAWSLIPHPVYKLRHVDGQIRQALAEIPDVMLQSCKSRFLPFHLKF